MEWLIEIGGKILATLGGLTGLVAIIMVIAKLLGKNWIESWFAKDLEAYKAELDTKNKEIQSKLDTKLELMRIEYGVLYSKRLSVIEDIHNRLLVIDKGFKIVLSIKQTNNICKDDILKIEKLIKEDIPQFENYLEKNRIYLPEDLSTVIQGSTYLKMFEFIAKMPENIKGLITTFLKSDNSTFSQEQKDSLDNSIKSIEDFYNSKVSTTPDVLFAIEQEFRRLIGAEIGSKK